MTYVDPAVIDDETAFALPKPRAEGPAQSFGVLLVMFACVAIVAMFGGL